MKQILKFPIRAQHNSESVTVYQAYNKAIGLEAALAGTLDVPAFSKTRMTWIKPQFLWMMYRCGWGRKDENQAVILQIEMTRYGFNHLLENACLSSFDQKVYDDHEAWKIDLAKRPNRVHWDPDKDMHLRPLERRAIQLGIAASFVPFYVHEAVIDIVDITEQAQNIEALIKAGRFAEANARLPVETEINSDWHV